MAVECKCSLGYFVNHEQSILVGCGSLPYTSIKSIFNTWEPYGQNKSKEQDLTGCTKLHKNDSVPKVCFPV